MALLWIFVIVLMVSVVVKLYIKLTTGWSRSNVCLVGKTVIITGANTGIGYETAADLAKRGAKLILACRNEQKAKDAVERIIRETDNPNVSYKILDLTSLQSVRNFAKDVIATEDRLDILVNNAGMLMVPEITGLTQDGLHPVMQTNYFGHFLLTHLLIDLLRKSTPSRIVNVSSVAARDPFFTNVQDINRHIVGAFPVYNRSKLCNVLFTIELAEKLKNSGITTYSLHPGVIMSEFTRSFPPVLKELAEYGLKFFFKDAVEGAQTTIYCAVTKGIEEQSGRHFSDCHVIETYRSARNPELAKALWKKSEELVKLEKKLS